MAISAIKNLTSLEMLRRNLYDFPHETERDFVDLPVGMYDSTTSFNFLPSNYGTLVVFKGLYRYGAFLWFSSENKVYIRNFYVDASQYEFRGNWKELGGVNSKLPLSGLPLGGRHEERDPSAPISNIFQISINKFYNYWYKRLYGYTRIQTKWNAKFPFCSYTNVRTKCNAYCIYDKHRWELYLWNGWRCYNECEDQLLLHRITGMQEVA